MSYDNPLIDLPAILFLRKEDKAMGIVKLRDLLILACWNELCNNSGAAPRLKQITGFA
jgi:hypothetical protein